MIRPALPCCLPVQRAVIMYVFTGCCSNVSCSIVTSPLVGRLLLSACDGGEYPIARHTQNAW